MYVRDGRPEDWYYEYQCAGKEKVSLRRWRFWRETSVIVLFQDGACDTAGGALYAVVEGRTAFIPAEMSCNPEPDAPITREQMAVIVSSYAARSGVEIGQAKNLSRFPDAFRISTWAVHTGLFSGDGQGNLTPAGPASRAEASAPFQRFCRVLAD